jgi:hypothetical protein
MGRSELKPFFAANLIFVRMKIATRLQFYRLSRILEMVREGTRTGQPPNCSDFHPAIKVLAPLELKQRTIAKL